MTDRHCTNKRVAGGAGVRAHRETRAAAKALRIVTLLATFCAWGCSPAAESNTDRNSLSTPTLNSPGGAGAGAPGVSGGVNGMGTAMTPGIATVMTTPGAMPSGTGMMGVTGFDGESSMEVFSKTLYPILRDHCAACHSESPQGKDQLPLHASNDLATAHMWALTKINLRQPAQGRLVQRQSIEGHHCWSDCVANGKEILNQVTIWANAVKASLPVSTLMVHPGPVMESEVLAWINADKAKIAPSDAQYIKYASLHRIQNRSPTPDEMNLARVGLSKILNSTSIGGPKIVNPIAIDPFSLVYRFDIRDYWGFNLGGAPNPSHALDNWARVLKGNYNADDQTAGPNTFANKDTPASSMAKNTPTFPNIAGFYPDYVDAAQLGYTLSRPDVYADLMKLGTLSPGLETSLGVKETGVTDWRFVTVDDAITINKRMLLRQSTQYGYFWKGIDPFGQAPFIFYDRPVPEMDGFSLVKTTPVFDSKGNYSESYGITLNADGTLVGGVQAQASEMIYSLPNGLQGYFIGGGLNQIRVDAFSFIVFDPRRGGTNMQASTSGFRLGAGSELRLLTPASCMSCHMDGMNRAVDDMDGYIKANPTKFDSATVAKVKQLYMGLPGVRKVVEDDRAIYGKAMAAINNQMIVGMTDKTVYYEPIMYLFESAISIFNYVETASN